MFINVSNARFLELGYSRTLIGIVGAVLANAVLAASIEHLTRVAALV